jgi:archaellum component FlaC
MPPCAFARGDGDDETLASTCVCLVENISNYFNALEQRVNLQTESVVHKIEEYSRELKNEIKKYENECIESFGDKNFKIES